MTRSTANLGKRDVIVYHGHADSCSILSINSCFYPRTLNPKPHPFLRRFFDTIRLLLGSGVLMAGSESFLKGDTGVIQGCIYTYICIYLYI